MAFYHIIMIVGVVIVFLIMIWTQMVGGKKYFGKLWQKSYIAPELFKRITSDCASWRNSAQVYLYIESTLMIYSILSSLICVYIASRDVKDWQSIILYSILSILFSGIQLVVKFRATAIGYRESFVEMKVAIMKHSAGLISDEELLNTFKKCEERISKSVF